jgi:hypothetical protein
MIFKEILQLSPAAYYNEIPSLPVYIPDSWREAFGRVYVTPEPTEEVPEPSPEEKTDVTFAEYLEFLGHPGGVTRFLRQTEDGWLDDTVNPEWVFIQIPWDKVSDTASISLMKEDLADMLSQTATPYHHRMINAVQFRREFPMAATEI